MRAGMVGLGKLGLPCLLAMEKYGGHEVFGHEANPETAAQIERKEFPHKEEGDVPGLLAESRLRLVDVDYLVAACDIIFVAVQTPHLGPEYEGVTDLPADRKDFDYTHLEAAVKALAESADRQQRFPIVSVISTVLPGTIRRQILPLAGKLPIAYNPYFIAMGTTIPDFLNPEFVVLGCQDGPTASMMESFYSDIHKAKVVRLTYEEAELVKTTYNTFIGMKIAFANTVMELSHKLGADCDKVVDALSLAKKRIVSPAYLRGGMGDGGGCHPRDNIAMSWLAKRVGLSHNLFEDIMKARQDQSYWLLRLVEQEYYDSGIERPQVMVLGRAFKPETNLTVGSPARLLIEQLNGGGHEAVSYDPHIDAEAPDFSVPRVYFVATKHAAFAGYKFAAGSTVIDPFRYIPDQDGVKVICLGRK